MGIVTHRNFNLLRLGKSADFRHSVWVWLTQPLIMSTQADENQKFRVIKHYKDQA
jgi:hypothetical protein